jgi:mannose-6-phosphate isomerase
MKNGLKVYLSEILIKKYIMKILFKDIEKQIKSFGFNVSSFDFSKPWGGFLVIDESQAQEFSNKFFKGLDVNILKIGGKLSPKILIVKPKTRLSWQYHNRRAEIWQIYKGSAGIVRSDSDVENEMGVYNEGDQIVLEQGERHRLIGLDDYSVVAEMWQHTDADHPSDEDDIIRVQDDFGR